MTKKKKIRISWFSNTSKVGFKQTKLHKIINTLVTDLFKIFLGFTSRKGFTSQVLQTYSSAFVLWLCSNQLNNAILVLSAEHLNHMQIYHRYKKRKDSMETRAAFSWISILTWKFGGDPSDSALASFKMASTYGNFLYDNDFHAVVTITGC